MATTMAPAPQLTSREKLTVLVTAKPYLTNVELATILNISVSRVQQIIEAEGLDKRRLREAWFEDQRELVKLFASVQGDPLEHPSVQFELSAEAVLPQQE